MYGSLIRDARRAARLTQAELAARLGTSQPSVARLEAAGADLTLGALEQALGALGRELVIEVVERVPAVDAARLEASLRRAPAERLGALNGVAALLARLEGVDFVVVGGVAATLHGCTRATRELDVIGAPASQNVERLLSDDDVELRRVGEHGIHLATRHGAVNFYVQPDGYDELRARAMTARVGDVTVRYAHIDDVIAAARPRDRAELEAIRDRAGR